MLGRKCARISGNQLEKIYELPSQDTFLHSLGHSWCRWLIGWVTRAWPGVVAAAAALPWPWVRSGTMLPDNNKMAADKADYTSSSRSTGAQRSVEPASPELAEEALVQVGLLGSRAVSALSCCWFSWPEQTSQPRASCASKRSCKILLLSFLSDSSRAEKARRGGLARHCLDSVDS